MNATMENGDLLMREAAVVKNVVKHSGTSFSNAADASSRPVSDAKIIGCKGRHCFSIGASLGESFGTTDLKRGARFLRGSLRY